MVAGCDSDERRAAEEKGTELSPTEASERASRLPLELTVVPRVGHRTSIIRIGFKTPIRIGTAAGNRRRGYFLVATTVEATTDPDVAAYSTATVSSDRFNLKNSNKPSPCS